MENPKDNESSEACVSVQVIFSKNTDSAPIWLRNTNESIGTASVSNGEIAFDVTSPELAGKKLVVQLLTPYGIDPCPSVLKK